MLTRRFLEISLAATFAAYLTALVFVFSSSEQPCPETNKQHHSDRAKETGSGQQDESLRHWVMHDATGFFTLLLSIVSGCQLVLFWVQLKYIREGLGDTKVAADAAKEAADAANVQAKVAQDTLTQLERPYLFIFGVDRFYQDRETKEFFVEYTVANYGKLPAIVTDAYIGFEFSACGAPAIPTLVADSHTMLTTPTLQAGEKREKIREYLPAGMAKSDIIVDTNTGEILPVLDVPQNNDVFFRTLIKYSGPFSEGHETSVLWLADYPCAGSLSQRGGKQYNYTK